MYSLEDDRAALGRRHSVAGAKVRVDEHENAPSPDGLATPEEA